MSCPVVGLLNNSSLLFVFNVHAFTSNLFRSWEGERLLDPRELPTREKLMVVSDSSVAMTTRLVKNLRNNMAAEKRTISAIGLLKDVEFHMVKAAAEVSLVI